MSPVYTRSTRIKNFLISRSDNDLFGIFIIYRSFPFHYKKLHIYVGVVKLVKFVKGTTCESPKVYIDEGIICFRSDRSCLSCVSSRVD